MRQSLTALSVCLAAVGGLAGCGSNAKQYDIAPVFPLSADKCKRYDGDQEGSGVAARCMVTKAECEQAAADWRDAMRDSYVNDAINFVCKD